MRISNLGLSLASFMVVLSLFNHAAEAATPARPKLILTIVIDQFRADYLLRYESRLSAGGMKLLMDAGAYYPFGEYDLLHSMTGPGHATILSGAYPYQLGVVLNTWFDGETNKRMYCAQDEASPTIGPAGMKDPGPNVGTSPRNSLATTVGDELKNAGYPSHVVSVALKDRAAIYMGGKRPDIAVWMDAASYNWVSSKYYLPDGKLPKWMEAANTDLTKKKGQTVEWKGAGFNHATQIGDKPSLDTPFGMELTVDMAERAIDAYSLGRGKATDLLAVSFSSFDYIGHGYGPNSPEIESAVFAEDRAIARLLGAVKAKVPGGLRDVVVVLTADHGVAPTPEYATDAKLGGGRVDEKKIMADIGAALTEKFGKPSSDAGEWMPFAEDLNFWFNRKALADRKAPIELAEEIARGVLQKLPATSFVFTASDYAKRKLPPGQFEARILRQYMPGRSGDVVVIPKPYWIPSAGGGHGTTHYTGYAYDRTVPIVFMGRAFKPGRYATTAKVVDIAPTLSFIAGAIPPNMSEGRVLSEALSAK